MLEFIEFIRNDEASIFFVTFISVLITLISTVIMNINHKIRSKESKNKSQELYKLVKVQEENSKIELVKNSFANIPDGLSEDEYFDKIKGILSELSYNNIKNSETNSQEKSIEDLIRTHHEQALTQAAIQFWTSLVASIFGFVFIIIMIVLANGSQWYEYVLKVLPGVIIETVSYLFFKQSSETRSRATEFLNKLRSDDQISKSIVIADSIDDTKLKSIIKAKIALHICGIKDSLDSNELKNTDDSN